MPVRRLQRILWHRVQRFLARYAHHMGTTTRTTPPGHHHPDTTGHYARTTTCGAVPGALLDAALGARTWRCSWNKPQRPVQYALQCAGVRGYTCVVAAIRRPADPECPLPPALLELLALRCERDDRVLFDGLDLRLHGGEALQLRGANGAGKTTLLRCIAGLHPDFDGEIRLPADRPATTALLFVGHRPGISSGLTAAENLRWHQQLGGGAAMPEAIGNALAQVGLSGWEDVPCAQMSAGQQRRVALARLVLPGAQVPLWLLDEPFTALDDAGVALVLALMRTQLERGGALVFATHQPVTDLPGLRTLRIEAGRAVADAASEAA